MQSILFLSVITSFILLTIYGAGIYAWTVLASAVGIALAATITTWRTVPSHTQSTHSRYPIIIIVILATITISLIPLPKELTRLTGNRRYAQNQVAATTLSRASNLGICKLPPLTFSTTRNRAGSMRVLALMIAAICTFESVRLMTNSKRLIILHSMILIGVIVAILGYISAKTIPQGDKLWWVFPVPPFQRKPVGAFLNANHYAGFIAMLSSTALAATLLNLKAKRWGWAGAVLLAGLCMATYVLISASRGAILAWTTGVIATTLIAVRSLRGRIRLTAIITTALAILLGGLIISQHKEVQARLYTLRHPTTDSSLQPRLSAWKGTIRLWSHYPLLGTGANAFRFTYPQHKDSKHRAYRRFAENEVLHILGEGGILGLTLTGALLISILLLIHRGFKSGPPLSGLALCSCAAMAVGAIHTSVDFILHLPLYALTLAALLAMGTPQTPPTRSRKWMLSLALATAIILIPSLLPMSHYDTSAEITTASPDKLATLLTWAPTSSQHWRRLSATIAQQPTPAAQALAEHCLEQAVVYDPTDFNIWIRLGERRLANGNKAGAQIAFDKATAIRSWAPVPKITP